MAQGALVVLISLPVEDEVGVGHELQFGQSAIHVRRTKDLAGIRGHQVERRFPVSP